MSVAPHQLFITVVHGTWPDGLFRTLLGRKRRTYWFDDGSSFFTRLSAELGDVPHRIKSLPWCGENSVYERDNAAQHLADDLSAEHNEHPQATQLVVAHSHGGNIALRALYYLQKREGSLVYGEESATPLVVTLATPFVEIHPADSGQRSFLVRLAPISAFVLPLSIFASPVLTSVVEHPSASAVSLLAALLLSIGVLGAWGWYWMGRVAARQKQVESLSDATRLGEVSSAQRLLVIRAVDDEAYLVMALGTILTYIFTTLIALMVMVVSPFVGVPLSFILLHYSKLPSDESRVEYAVNLEAWYQHVFTFGCCALIIAMFGALIVSRLAHGRELAKSPMDCQINTQSAPDATGLKIVTLVSEKHVKWFGRHGIYEHDNCAKAVSDWVRAQLGVQLDS
jgi:hypothetical protein